MTNEQLLDIYSREIERLKNENQELSKNAEVYIRKIGELEEKINALYSDFPLPEDCEMGNYCNACRFGEVKFDVYGKIRLVCKKGLCKHYKERIEQLNNSEVE